MQQQTEHQELAGVVTHTLRRLGAPVLDSLRWHTSPRGSRNRVPPGDLSVLCYVPNWKLLAFAQRTACNGSVAVVESPPEEIEGWARWHGAMNLTTGTRAQPLADDLHEHLEMLIHFGNNGYGPQFDRRQALSTLGDIDPEDIYLVWGALIAAGVSADGVDLLQEATSTTHR